MDLLAKELDTPSAACRDGEFSLAKRNCEVSLTCAFYPLKRLRLLPSSANFRMPLIKRMLLVSAFMLPFALGASVVHPLDALTAGEISTARSIILEDKVRAGEVDFVYLSLAPPPKSTVLEWREGDPVPRAAFFALRENRKVYEGTVDLDAGRVLRREWVPDVQSRIILRDYGRADAIIKGHLPWQEAMRKRGFASFDEIRNVHYSAGNFGSLEEAGRRLLHAVSYDAREKTNFWGRPIEGVFIIVDLDSGEVVRMVDTGVVPIPDAKADFDEESVGTLREIPTRLSLHQPDGPGFTVSGQFIRWQNWRFHRRIDPRVGLVLSLIRYRDNGADRMVLYEASLSELFVPYMEPSAGWYSRTYFDIGDYGLGMSLSTLKPGLDCPPDATLFDATLAGNSGEPEVYSAVCAIFERTAGNPAWRHYDFASDETESRPSRELVVRTVTTLGNYDYILDWIFQQDGTIRIAVGSTGVVAVSAVPVQGPGSEAPNRADAYGRYVDDHLVAINHDHFFNFRLDFDIDGEVNSFALGHLRTHLLREENPRRSLWVVEPQIADNEWDARLRIDLEKPSLWRVINPDVTHPTGYPVGYAIKPRGNALPLLHPDDFPQQRAAFTGYHLWVTPYRDDERYAAGDYPNQSRPGEGLPKWTAANRGIKNTDIVVWYTLGFHHVVRSEDWPVMPLTWNGFELRAFNFFSRNPALDLPEASK